MVYHRLAVDDGHQRRALCVWAERRLSHRSALACVEHLVDCLLLGLGDTIPQPGKPKVQGRVQILRHSLVGFVLDTHRHAVGAHCQVIELLQARVLLGTEVGQAEHISLQAVPRVSKSTEVRDQPLFINRQGGTVEVTGDDTQPRQRVCRRKTASAVRIGPALDAVKALRDVRVDERAALLPSAHVATGLRDEVSRGVVPKGDPEFVQPGLERRPDARDEAGVQHSGVIREVLLDGFGFTQLAVGHGGVNRAAYSVAGLVDSIHQPVERCVASDSAHPKVTHSLMRQHGLQVVLVADVVREDYDVAITE